MEEETTISEFERIKLEVGTIIKAEGFLKAHNPSYKLWVRFSNGTVKKSSAQITANYSIKDLIYKQVICVTNLAPKQIGDFMSEILVTGFEDKDGNIILAVPDKPVPDGKRLY